MQRVLVDASNLHVGGGVQVAASLIEELTAIVGEDSKGTIDLTVQCSSAVGAAVDGKAERPFALSVADSRFRSWTVPEGRWDAALTIFGPAYRRRVAPLEIVGVAIPSIGYGVGRVGITARVRMESRMRNAAKLSYLRRADIVIAETEHFARALKRHLPASPIKVIGNAPSRAFLDQARQLPQAPARGDSSGQLRVAVVARDYPHKNLNFIGQLGQAIEAQSGRSPVFEVTLTQDEWRRKSQLFKKYAHNNGLVNTDGLIEVFGRCHISLLPSLQEVASVTPYESIAVGLPTFVSDRGFMRELMRDAVFYIDPLDPVASSTAILRTMADSDLLVRNRTAASSLLAEIPCARERAESYLMVILDALHSRKGTGPNAP
jgi:glycosyltransferase involved in cell wall biosynthesis